jgi:hypothetical protein
MSAQAYLRVARNARTMLAIGTLTKATETLQWAPCKAVTIAPPIESTDTHKPANWPVWRIRRSSLIWERSRAWRWACSASAIVKIRSAPLSTTASNCWRVAGGGKGPLHWAETISRLFELAFRADSGRAGVVMGSEGGIKIRAYALPIAAHGLQVRTGFKPACVRQILRHSIAGRGRKESTEKSGPEQRAFAAVFVGIHGSMVAQKGARAQRVFPYLALYFVSMGRVCG